MLLPGERLYLRPTEMSDIPLLQRWINDPQTRRYLVPFGPANELVQKRYIESISGNDHDYSLAVVLRRGDRHIGQVGLHGVDWVNRCGRFGIMIGPHDARGKGYGGEATRLMMTYAFESLNLHRIELEVYDFNDRARRLYERLGFIAEGTRRQARWSGAAYADSHLYSMLADEYFAIAGR